MLVRKAATAEEDRRQHRHHVGELVDLAHQEPVRDLILARVGADAAVGREQRIELGDHRLGRGAAQEREREVVEGAVEIVGGGQRLASHAEHAEALLVGHQRAGRHRVDVLGRERQADHRERALLAVDQRVELRAGAEAVRVGEGLREHHLVGPVRRDQPPAPQEEPVQQRLAVLGDRDDAADHRLLEAGDVEQREARDARLDRAHARDLGDAAHEAFGRALQRREDVGEGSSARRRRPPSGAAPRSCRATSPAPRRPRRSPARSRATCPRSRQRSRSSLRSSARSGRSGSPDELPRRRAASACARSSTMRPSPKRITRSAISAMPALWVISAVAVPSSRFTASMASSTSTPVALSSAPVGSSQSSSSRLLGDRARDRDALLLAARELRGEVVEALAEPDQAQRVLGRHRRSRDLGHQRHVLARGEARDQVVELEHEAHVQAPVAGEPGLVARGQLAAVEPDVAGGRRCRARRGC